MFLHASVILFTGGRACVPCMPHLGMHPPATHTSITPTLGMHTPPLPCMPLPCMPPCHACPPAIHAPPHHTPPRAFMPPAMHAPYHTCPHPPQILRDVVNERAVRILLECILVWYNFLSKTAER